MNAHHEPPIENYWGLGNYEHMEFNTTFKLKMFSKSIFQALSLVIVLQAKTTSHLGCKTKNCIFLIAAKCSCQRKQTTMLTWPAYPELFRPFLVWKEKQRRLKLNKECKKCLCTRISDSLNCSAQLFISQLKNSKVDLWIYLFFKAMTSLESNFLCYMKYIARENWLE